LTLFFDLEKKKDRGGCAASFPVFRTNFGGKGTTLKSHEGGGEGKTRRSFNSTQSSKKKIEKVCRKSGSLGRSMWQGVCGGFELKERIRRSCGELIKKEGQILPESMLDTIGGTGAKEKKEDISWVGLDWGTREEGVTVRKGGAGLLDMLGEASVAENIGRKGNSSIYDRNAAERARKKKERLKVGLHMSSDAVATIRGGYSRAKGRKKKIRCVMSF